MGVRAGGRRGVDDQGAGWSETAVRWGDSARADASWLAGTARTVVAPVASPIASTGWGNGAGGRVAGVRAGARLYSALHVRLTQPARDVRSQARRAGGSPR